MQKLIECAVQEHWRTNDTYATVKQHRSAGKPFFFVDGPPYTTGTIHLGTAWNKILKRLYPALPPDERPPRDRPGRL